MKYLPKLSNSPANSEMENAQNTTLNRIKNQQENNNSSSTISQQASDPLITEFIRQIQNEQQRQFQRILELETRRLCYTIGNAHMENFLYPTLMSSLIQRQNGSIFSPSSLLTRAPSNPQIGTLIVNSGTTALPPQMPSLRNEVFGNHLLHFNNRTVSSPKIPSQAYTACPAVNSCPVPYNQNVVTQSNEERETKRKERNAHERQRRKVNIKLMQELYGFVRKMRNEYPQCLSQFEMLEICSGVIRRAYKLLEENPDLRSRLLPVDSQQNTASLTIGRRYPSPPSPNQTSSSSPRVIRPSKTRKSASRFQSIYTVESLLNNVPKNNNKNVRERQRRESISSEIDKMYNVVHKIVGKYQQGATWYKKLKDCVELMHSILELYNSEVSLRERILPPSQ